MDAQLTKPVAWSMFLPYPMLWLGGLVLVYCLGYLIDINSPRYFLRDACDTCSILGSFTFLIYIFLLYDCDCSRIYDRTFARSSYWLSANLQMARGAPFCRKLVALVRRAKSLDRNSCSICFFLKS